MENWKVKLRKMFNEVDIVNTGNELLDKLYLDDVKETFAEFIQQELDKAKEEGYEKGVKDGMKGKVFNKVEIKEEAHISKELIEKIREVGILEVLAMLDDYNHPSTFTAEYVREQIIKLLEEEIRQ